VSPAASLFDISRAGEPDSRRVAPDGTAQRAIVDERFIHHVPRVDLAGVAARYGIDVVRQDRRKLGRPYSRR